MTLPKRSRASSGAPFQLLPCLARVDRLLRGGFDAASWFAPAAPNGALFPPVGFARRPAIPTSLYAAGSSRLYEVLLGMAATWNRSFLRSAGSARAGEVSRPVLYSGGVYGYSDLDAGRRPRSWLAPTGGAVERLPR